MCKQTFKEQLTDIRVSDLAANHKNILALRKQADDLNNQSKEIYQTAYENVRKQDGVSFRKPTREYGPHTLRIRVDNPLAKFYGQYSVELFDDDFGIWDYVTDVFKEMGFTGEEWDYVTEALDATLEKNHLVVNVDLPNRYYVWEDESHNGLNLMWAAHFLLHKRTTFREDIQKYMNPKLRLLVQTRDEDLWTFKKLAEVMLCLDWEFDDGYGFPPQTTLTRPPCRHLKIYENDSERFARDTEKWENKYFDVLERLLDENDFGIQLETEWEYID